MDTTKTKVLWTGDPEKLKVGWIARHLHRIKGDPVGDIVTLRESDALYNTEDFHQSVSLINDQLMKITEIAVANQCGAIVFPVYAKLTDTFFNALPDGIEILMEDSCKAPSGQWATTSGLPYLVTSTEFCGWYHVTGVDRYTTEGGAEVFTMIREDIDILPEDIEANTCKIHEE